VATPVLSFGLSPQQRAAGASMRNAHPAAAGEPVAYLCADSGEVARSFRDHVARLRRPAGQCFFWRKAYRWSIPES
jgi:hypothetical protein